MIEQTIDPLRFIIRRAEGGEKGGEVKSPALVYGFLKKMVIFYFMTPSSSPEKVNVDGGLQV